MKRREPSRRDGTAHCTALPSHGTKQPGEGTGLSEHCTLLMPLPVLSQLSTQRKCSTRQYASFFNVGCGIPQSARSFQYKAELCLPHGTNIGDTNTGHKFFNSACSYKTFSRLQKNIFFVILEEPDNIFIFNNMNKKNDESKVADESSSCDSRTVTAESSNRASVSALGHSTSACCLRQQRDVMEKHSNV